VEIKESTATSLWVWGEGYEPYPKRDETIVMSDVCSWWQTATAVETQYTTDPKLTATVTSYAHTKTTTSVYMTETF
jgi:hypothetical protein